MSLRLLSAIGLLCASVLGLSHGTAHAQSEKTLTLWHAYGDAEASGLKAALDAFRAEHPEVRITVVHNAFGAYASKLESAIPTGHGPDVFIDAHERLGTYRQSHLVQPLRAIPAGAKDDFEPNHLAALSIDGALYGLPTAVKCAALYVNDTLLPEPPEFFEDYIGLTGKLGEGVFPIVFETENAYYDAALLHAFGGRLLSDNGDYAFFGAPAEATLQNLARFIKTKTVPEEANGDLVKQLFTQGKAGAAISGPWLAPDLPESLSYRVVPLPRVRAANGEPMRPFATVEGVFLASGAKDVELAQKLIAFIAGPEGALPRALAGQQVVASRGAWTRPELAESALLRAFQKAATEAVPMSTHPNMRTVFEPSARAIRKTLRGDVAPAVALAEAKHRFEDITRPFPEEQNPFPAYILLSLALVALALFGVHRARDAQFRADVRASTTAYKYVAHAFIAVGLLVFLPIFVGGVTSLFAGRGMDMHYVGLTNYIDILSNRGNELLGHGSFWLVLLVTVLWTGLNVGLHVVIGVALALLLNRKGLKLKGTYRVLLILPWAVPNYVTALTWKGLFHRQFGAVNAALDALGVEPVSWFAQFSTAFAANLATNVWLGFPFMMVVTLGALAAIPKDLYEAASVDGATQRQQFWLITAPMLRPMLAPAIALGAMWTFNMFNVVFLVSGGEPDGSTDILVSEAYRWAFTRGMQYGYASAYAVLVFLVLLFTTRMFTRRMEAMGGTR